MFSRSFLLQSSLFFCSHFQDENKNFHPDRAPHRDCDHRDIGGDAAACAGEGKSRGEADCLCRQLETAVAAGCELSE